MCAHYRTTGTESFILIASTLPLGRSRVKLPLCQKRGQVKRWEGNLTKKTGVRQDYMTEATLCDCPAFMYRRR